MTDLQNVRLFQTAQEARRVITSEIEGLQSLCQSLDGSYDHAVNLLLSAKGRIIVTGMGKSGHIGCKISATLTSTGTPSLFVHPAEASHGDMGMITQDDVILALSCSGETKELSDILSYAKLYKIPIVSITQNPKSTLARHSNVVLRLPKVREACPNALAPTTSTTMTLVMGDALAMTLLRMKGFSAQDFKRFHPGGNLGKQLCRVRDVMCVGDAMPLMPDTAKMSEALIAMTNGRLGCVGIVNNCGALIGIITDGDLRRHMNDHLATQNVKEIMTPNPQVISSDTMAVEALCVLNDQNITNLFIVSDFGVPLGVFNLHVAMHFGVYA